MGAHSTTGHTLKHHTNFETSIKFISIPNIQKRQPDIKKNIIFKNVQKETTEHENKIFSAPKNRKISIKSFSNVRRLNSFSL